MRKKELIKQLNTLKETIKPDSDWKAENRNILLSQIKAQSRLDFAKVKTNFVAKVIPQNIILPILKPVASFALIVFFISIAWTASVDATKNSLPGDLFYNIKLTTERVQSNLALNDEKRTNLEIEFAERRLDEITQLMASPEPQNNNNLNITLQKFQENMVNVKSSLAKLEKNDKQRKVFNKILDNLLINLSLELDKK